jgi:hypothetical protein
MATEGIRMACELLHEFPPSAVKLAGHDFQFEEAKTTGRASSIPQEGLGLLWSVLPPSRESGENP